MLCETLQVLKTLANFTTTFEETKIGFGGEGSVCVCACVCVCVTTSTKITQTTCTINNFRLKHSV